MRPSPTAEQRARNAERTRCLRIVSVLTMDACACGGSGPGEGCPICDLYHQITALIGEPVPQEET